MKTRKQRAPLRFQRFSVSAFQLFLLLALLIAPASQGAQRVIRVEGVTLAPGETNRVRLVLESLGNEKALGFNIAYDPEVLTFVQAVAGPGAVNAGADLAANPNQTTNFGRLGLTLSKDLFSTNTFPAGTNVIADVYFTSVPGLANGVSAITFTNAPGVTEISDWQANELPATYIGGSVSVVLTCAYSLNTNAAVFSDAGGPGTMNLVANDESCGWTITNNNSWIVLSSATNGAGSDTVEFSVEPNTELTERVGVVVIAGQTFTVTQQGVICSYALTPSAGAHSAAAETNSFDVITASPCPWSVSNAHPWVTILSGSNGVGNGPVTYTVADNISTSPRAGTLFVAGQEFTVTQEAIICSYALAPAAAVHGFAAETNSFNVTTTNVCPWSVGNTNTWITILAGSNGLGSGSVTYTVADNLTGSLRSGALVIDGETFVVMQEGILCSYALSPSSHTYSLVAETNSFTVTTTNPCPWSISNTNAWIEILSGSAGTGAGTVTYAVAENTSPSPRSGTLVVADQVFTVTQDGIACDYALSSSNATYGAAATTNTVTLTTTNVCPWSVDNTNSWITILAGSNGIGSADVTYALEANVSLVERTGALLIGGSAFVVTQQAVVCSYALTPSNSTHSAAAATNSFAVIASAPCPWSVVNTNPWITILAGESGAGDETVTYSIGANPISLERSGTLVVEGLPFTVTQQGISCSFSVSPTRRTHGFGSASNFFTVNTGAGCLWTVVNTNPWIHLAGSGSGNGTGPCGYLVDPNPTSSERIGFLTVPGATLIITQRTATCTYTVSPTNLTQSTAGGTGTVSIAAGSTCSWTAATTNDWIFITSTPGGSGNGSFQYAVLANWTSAARTGAVTVAGQTLPVTQEAYTDGFVFRSIEVSGGDQLSFSIIGGPLGVWELQVSDDLSTWSKLADLTNATGRVDYLNSIAPVSNRFYRAVLP